MDLQITETVLDVIKKTIKDDSENQVNMEFVDTIGMDTTLAQLHLSSLLFIKIITNIELRLEIEFEYEMLDMKQFDIISSIVSYAEKKVKNNFVTH
ncbi:MAG: hypothetical protein PHG06_22345 [Parabacteroides sp.]|jgi:acyl carrier protein|nr:hypothetical protein [Parabacteroides sp.]